MAANQFRGSSTEASSPSFDRKIHLLKGKLFLVDTKVLKTQCRALFKRAQNNALPIAGELTANANLVTMANLYKDSCSSLTLNSSTMIRTLYGIFLCANLFQ